MSRAPQHGTLSFPPLVDVEDLGKDKNGEEDVRGL